MHKPLLMAAMAAAIATAPTAYAQYKPLKGDPDILNVGIIATEPTQTLRDQWLPFLADMEKQVVMTIKPFFAPDYAGVIEGMRFGKVHVAWFGNKSGMQAVDRVGAEVFAQQAETGGRQGYHSDIITHVDNKHINSLEDLFATCGERSLNFGIGDPNSTSGFLVPSHYVFARNEVDPKKCLKTVRNSNHETNLMTVANKQAHAAANNSEQLYPIRQLALFRDKLKIERDGRMDEAKKAKKLKEIDDRLADLELFAAKTM